MKKSLVLTLALAVGLALTGCSKEENGNMEEDVKRAEQIEQDYFEEPILDFSLTLEQLKAREKHVLNRENLWDATETGEQIEAADPWMALYEYIHKDGKIGVFYCWPDKNKGSIYWIGLTWIGQKGISVDKIRQQLTERYGEPIVRPGSSSREYRSSERGIRVIESHYSLCFLPYQAD